MSFLMVYAEFMLEGTAPRRPKRNGTLLLNFLRHKCVFKVCASKNPSVTATTRFPKESFNAGFKSLFIVSYKNKKTPFGVFLFLVRETGLVLSLRASVSRGSAHSPKGHSLPLPFKPRFYSLTKQKRMTKCHPFLFGARNGTLLLNFLRHKCVFKVSASKNPSVTA